MRQEVCPRGRFAAMRGEKEKQQTDARAVGVLGGGAARKNGIGILAYSIDDVMALF